MRIRLVETVDLNEFAPMDKLTNWASREEIVGKVCDLLNKKGYRTIKKGTEGFYIKPNTDYLARITFDFSKDGVVGVTSVASLPTRPVTTKGTYELDDKGGIANADGDFLQKQVKSVLLNKNHLFNLKEDLEGLNEDNIFSRIKNKLASTAAKAVNATVDASNKRKDRKALEEAANKILKNLRLGGLKLKAEVADVNEGNNTVDVDLHSDGKEDYIFYIGLGKKPGAEGEILVDYVEDYLGNKENLVGNDKFHSLQAVVDRLSRVLRLGNLQMDSSAAERSGSSEEEVVDRAQGSMINNLEDERLKKLFENVLTEAVLDADKLKNVEKAFLAGAYKVGGKTVPISKADQKTLFQYYLSNSVDTSKQPEDLFDIDAINALYDHVLSTKTFATPLIFYAINFAKRHGFVSDKQISVMSASDMEDILSNNYTNIKSLIYAKNLWNISNNYDTVKRFLKDLIDVQETDFSKFDKFDKKVLQGIMDMDAAEFKQFVTDLAANKDEAKKKIYVNKNKTYRAPEQVHQILSAIKKSGGGATAASGIKSSKGTPGKYATVEAIFKDKGVAISDEDLVDIKETIKETIKKLYGSDLAEKAWRHTVKSAIMSPIVGASITDADANALVDRIYNA